MNQPCPPALLLVIEDGEKKPSGGVVPSTAVNTIQPRKKHPPCDPHAAPLNPKIMEFLCLIRSRIGPCALSGSAALSQLLHERDSPTESAVIKKVRKLRKNNDIDFFVPQCPNVQNCYEGKKIVEKERFKSFHDSLHECILPHVRGFRCKGLITADEICLEADSKTALNYDFLSLTPGIRDMLEVETPGKGPNIQIIILDRIVHPGEGTWDDTIPEDFDLNIVKLKVECKGLHDLRPKLAFVDPTAEACLEEGTFDYEVRPNQSHERCKNRIQKHLGRGFTIRSLRFDRRITSLGREQWCNDARKDLRLKLLRQLMETSQLAPMKQQTKTKKRTREGETDAPVVEPPAATLQRLSQEEWKFMGGKLEFISGEIKGWLPQTDQTTSNAITKLHVSHERDRLSSSAEHWSHQAERNRC